MIEITIIHPSHHRPVEALEAYHYWMISAVDPSRVEYIIAIDCGDVHKSEYHRLFNQALPHIPHAGRFLLTTSDSETGPQAGMHALEQSKKEATLFIQTADDVYPVRCWDLELLDRAKYMDHSRPMTIATTDGIQDPRYLQTLPIVNRAYLERVGHMICPEYTGIFADNEYTQVSQQLGAIEAHELEFKHNHYSIGKAHVDPTYSRRNSNAEHSWNGGIYHQRAARNFDL